ncbi:MAG: retroviral-like aspartic protease family protein [Methylococcales bacterium]
MDIVYTDLRLANHARADLDEINVTALVDTGALHLCIPEHVAVQLQLQSLKAREVQTADGKSHLVDCILGSQCMNC